MSEHVLAYDDEPVNPLERDAFVGLGLGSWRMSSNRHLTA